VLSRGAAAARCRMTTVETVCCGFPLVCSISSNQIKNFSQEQRGQSCVTARSLGVRNLSRVRAYHSLVRAYQMRDRVRGSRRGPDTHQHRGPELSTYWKHARALGMKRANEPRLHKSDGREDASLSTRSNRRRRGLHFRLGGFILQYLARIHVSAQMAISEPPLLPFGFLKTRTSRHRLNPMGGTLVFFAATLDPIRAVKVPSLRRSAGQ